MADQDKNTTDEDRAAWEGPERPASARPAKEAEPWEREVLARVATAAVDEQRRARRWNIFFKLAFLFYLFLILYLVRLDRPGAPAVSERHTALVELRGPIMDQGDASAENMIESLRSAFAANSSAGVILKINSPGGSPVEAGRIYDEIRRLKAKHPKKPLYVVVTEMCASGGYYVAAAADRIYADKASIVGSIGVRMSGLATFGFVDAMEKMGIERRLLTSGNDKGMLDPFSPLKEEEAAHIRNMLDVIHRQFIDAVRQGRGNRLKEDASLFTGLFWTGEQARGLGLIDGFGDQDYVAREVIKAEEVVDYTRQPPPLERLVSQFGSSVGAAFASTLGLRQSSVGF